MISLLTAPVGFDEERFAMPRLGGQDRAPLRRSSGLRWASRLIHDLVLAHPASDGGGDYWHVQPVVPLFVDAALALGCKLLGRADERRPWTEPRLFQPSNPRQQRARRGQRMAPISLRMSKASARTWGSLQVLSRSMQALILAWRSRSASSGESALA